MRDGRLRDVVAGALALAGIVGTWATSAAAQPSAPIGEWRAFGADAANTKYSPLDQITPENFTELEIAWRWRSISGEVAAEHEAIRPGPFKTAPLMIDGLVYVSTALGQVAALDAGTGELVWSYDPRTYDRLERPANMGWQHRGVSYWEDDENADARIFIATHDLLLVAMNARTGRLYPDFGADGAVDLSGSLGRPVDRSRLTHSQPLAVVGALIALVITDRSLSLPALMGFLLLVGIVVTNAIVLLTFVQQLRQRGEPPYEAVMSASRIRLRPILMTAFTTILALIPLSLSDSAGLVGAELATVVIGGLISSTFLTLVAVPVVYLLFEESAPNLYARVRRLIWRRPAESPGGDTDAPLEPGAAPSD